MNSKLREAVKRRAPNVTEELPTIQQDDEWNPMVNDEPPIEAYDETPPIHRSELRHTLEDE